MSIKVGLTGGIGAGKSLVSDIFKTLGVPVYYSDVTAKKLMIEHNDLKAGIIRNFGDEAYQGGKLNREYLSKQIFNNEGKRQKIHDLVHPLVQKDYLTWLKRHADAPYTLKEAALLFEAGTSRDLDKVILVYAPKALRLNRILLRDPHRSLEQVEHIMDKQMSDTKKKKLADYTVINDERKMVIPQVLEIHQNILKAI